MCVYVCGWMGYVCKYGTTDCRTGDLTTWARSMVHIMVLQYSYFKYLGGRSVSSNVRYSPRVM